MRNCNHILERKMADRFPELPEVINIRYTNLVIADQLFASVRHRLRQMTSLVILLATDKSRYFAQPRPIIVNYFEPLVSNHLL